MSVASPNPKSIFGRALEHQSLAERAAYLDAACAGNAAVRAEVEGLLAEVQKAGSFMERPAVPDDPKMLAPTLNMPVMKEGPGTRIGPYKLLQQIGEGGFGVVYLAAQEEPVRRNVALKIIKPGMDSREVIARFEAERQALALMDHQNIARVLDAGATDSGRPYFVMELVKGIPITTYCDNNKLTPRERLELFIPVCQAIQHAHQKGVIHRDIKPSNVLVCLYDGKPVPKVIDFGVAKAIEQRLTEKTLFTQHGQVVGTLEYMSPEQAELSQLDIDTRSDIYSLGVLLYELLTGTTPITKEQLRKAGFTEMLRMIRETEPDRPSIRLSHSHATLASLSAQRRTEPAKLGAILKGELDWLVMKALEKDRTRRYETAIGLARDIERYLQDEPVEACPPSVGYRVRKFIHRHRRTVVAGTTVALLILVLLADETYEHLRATAEAERARAAERLALSRLGEANEQRARAAEAEKVSLSERDKALVAEQQTREQRDLAEAARREAVKQLELTAAAEREAVQQRQRESRAREQATDALARSEFEQARAVRLSAQPGRRWQALDLLKHAESLRRRERAKIESTETPPMPQSNPALQFPALPAPSELRTEAVAALLLNDGRPVQKWDGLAHAVSPDGKYAASVAIDLAKGQSKVVVSDLQSGREISNWKNSAHVSGTSISLGPGGDRLAVLAMDLRQIALWDVRGGEKIGTLSLPEPLPPPAAEDKSGGKTPAPRSYKLIRHMTFSPDGRWLAGMITGTGDSTIVLWNLAEQNAARILATLKFFPTAIPVFSLDSSRLAFATGENMVTLWDIAANHVASEIELPHRTTGAIGFSPGGDLLAVNCQSFTSPQSTSSTVLIWDFREKRELARRETGSLHSTTPICFAPDGGRLAIAGMNGAIQVLDATAFGIDAAKGDRTPQGQPASRPGLSQPQPPIHLDHGSLPQLLAWNADGRRLLTGGLGSMKMWEFAAPESLALLRLEKSAALGRLAFSPEGRALAVESREGGQIALFDRNTGKKIRSWNRHVKSANGSFGLRYSPNGKQLVQFGSGGLVAWDVETGAEQFEFTVELGGVVFSVGFPPDGRVLAGGIHSYKPTFWDAATRKPIWQAQKIQVGSLTEISPNGRFGVVFDSFPTGINRPTTLLDTTTGQKRFDFPGPADKYQGLQSHQWSISPDSRWILAVHLAGPAGGVGSPVAQNFGTSLASLLNPDEPWAGEVWNAETGKRHVQIGGPSTILNSTFSPDGRILAVSMRNGTIRLWNVDAGQELFDWRPFANSTDSSNPPASLTFTADSATLAVPDPSAPVLHLLDLARLNRELAEVSLGW